MIKKEDTFSIKLKKSTKQQLDRMKPHPRATYDETINILLDYVKKYNFPEINENGG